MDHIKLLVIFPFLRDWVCKHSIFARTGVVRYRHGSGTLRHIHWGHPLVSGEMNLTIGSTNYDMMTSSHGKRLLRYWPFAKGIHRPLPSKKARNAVFDALFDVSLNTWLNKQSSCWWLETPWCPLWRHCNAFTLYVSHSDVAIISLEISVSVSWWLKLLNSSKKISGPFY